MPFEDMTFGPYDKAEYKVRKAFELYEDGKIAQALLELEAALEINPSNGAWHFNKGLTLDTINRFDDAISEYETALELNPEDLEILNSLAVDYTRTGQYDRAIDVFEHIQQLDHAFEPCYCNRIITYTETGQHDLAEQMFYLGQQINPDCALCYYNIGNSLFVRGEYKRAIHCWLKTAELEPTHPQINYRIAQAYWSQGEMSCAREHFLAELRQNPGETDVILDFGLFLLELGEIESAKEKFNRILELSPDCAAAVFYLGEIAFYLCEHEKAKRLFKEALEKDNNLTGPRYRLAQCCLAGGQKKQARGYLVSEMELAPEDAEALVSMGSMFVAVGELDLSTHCLLKAVDIDSGSPGMTDGFGDGPVLQKGSKSGRDHPIGADAYYYLGLVSAIKGQLNDASEFFAHTLDINPKDVRALRDSAVVYLAMGKLDDAAERVSKAQGLATGDSQLRALGRRVRLARATKRIVDFLWRLAGRFAFRGPRR